MAMVAAGEFPGPPARGPDQRERCLMEAGLI